MDQNNHDGQLDDYLSAINCAYKLVETIKLKVNKELKFKHLYYKHWIVLKLVFFNEAKTSSEIAQLISINKSSLSRLIDYLEEQELVTRTKDLFDGRQTNLGLTEKGKEVFKLGYEAFLTVPKEFDNMSVSTLKEISNFDHQDSNKPF